MKNSVMSLTDKDSDNLSFTHKNMFENSPWGFKITFLPYSDALRISAISFTIFDVNKSTKRSDKRSNKRVKFQLNQHQTYIPRLISFLLYIFCLCKAKHSQSGQTSREIKTDFLRNLVLIYLKVEQNSSHLIIFWRNQLLISQVLKEMRIINIMRDKELISLKNHVTWILCHCKRNQDHNSQKIQFKFPWTRGRWKRTVRNQP